MIKKVKEVGKIEYQPSVDTQTGVSKAGAGATTP
jgi:hypothetical protein